MVTELIRIINNIVTVPEYSCHFFVYLTLWLHVRNHSFLSFCCSVPRSLESHSSLCLNCHSFYCIKFSLNLISWKTRHPGRTACRLSDLGYNAILTYAIRNISLSCIELPTLQLLLKMYEVPRMYHSQLQKYWQQNCQRSGDWCPTLCFAFDLHSHQLHACKCSWCFRAYIGHIIIHVLPNTAYKTVYIVHMQSYHISK